jgi:dihydropteroate synthase
MKKTLNLKGNLLDLSTPIVMGILNTTPDSFHQHSRINSDAMLLSNVEKMLRDGVTILDIGGYSSRPDAAEVPIQEELNRTIPAIKQVVKSFPGAYISIDTFRSEVAQAALDAGACMVNDISGGTLDDNMFQIVADNNASYVCMHMRGTPQTMKQLTQYENLLLDILDFFVLQTNKLKALGVRDIILDPGFGFAKTIAQNYEILQYFQHFQQLKLPLLAGLSRKSMIYNTLNISPEDALNGTTALHMISLINGAQILRVHDLKEAVETIKLYKATYS